MEALLGRFMAKLVAFQTPALTLARLVQSILMRWEGVNVSSFADCHYWIEQSDEACL